MITLVAIMCAWFFLYYFNIKKKLGHSEFNPFEAGLINGLGFFLGIITILSTIAIVIIKYLP